MRILSAGDVRRAVPMPQAIDAVERAFIALSSATAEVPLRTRIELPQQQATSFFMPAHVQGEGLGLKIVSVFPHNQARFAMPTIFALVALIDPETGKPLAALDGTYLTALRTGAASGVATRHMARSDARVLAVFGAGAQARTQVLAVCCERTIERVLVVGRDPAKAQACVDQLRNTGAPIPPDVQLARPAQALAQADIVCLATNSRTPVFDDIDLRPGTHINGVGSYAPHMQELPAASVARARLIVDQRQAAWHEAGDLVLARDAGIISEAHVLAELGEVAAGRVAGRSSRDEISFFKSVGNAAQDIAVAALALARAHELGLGIDVDLGA